MAAVRWGQGWEEGQGLGKNKQGISTHVRVVKKFDNTGERLPVLRLAPACGSHSLWELLEAAAGIKLVYGAGAAAELWSSPLSNISLTSSARAGIGIAEARKEASNWSVNTAVFDAILKNLNVVSARP